MDKEYLKKRQAAYYLANKEKYSRNLELLKTDFKSEELLFYKEKIIDPVRCNLVPRRFQFTFKKLAGEYVIDKNNQKFISVEFLGWFFTKNYLVNCEKLTLKKAGEFYKINRENVLINKDIDLILRIIESNRRRGAPRKWIYLQNGERVNIQFTI